jgi:hypothetical protein
MDVRLTHPGFVYPRLARAGIANELIVLAKAYLAAVELGLPLVEPAWGFNRRPYWPYFHRTPLGGVAGQVAVRSLPRVVFTDAAYRRTGLTDYGEAVRVWHETEPPPSRRPFALECAGMWGGFVAIDRAREYVRCTLQRTRFTGENVVGFLGRRDSRRLLVGLHVRRGDFEPARMDGAGVRGVWNQALPLAWYAAVAGRLRREFDDTVQFAVFSDGPPLGLAPLVDRLDGALTTFDQRHRDCSDLLLMSMCDVLICSASSYSLMAAWLSEQPYVWPEQQCWLQDGMYSLWGYEAAQGPPEGLTSANSREVGPADRDRSWHPRGVTVGPDAALPGSLLVFLNARLKMRDRRTDLLYYGVVPATAEPERRLRGR